MGVALSVVKLPCKVILSLLCVMSLNQVQSWRLNLMTFERVELCWFSCGADLYVEKLELNFRAIPSYIEVLIDVTNSSMTVASRYTSNRRLMLTCQLTSYAQMQTYLDHFKWRIIWMASCETILRRKSEESHTCWINTQNTRVVRQYACPILTLLSHIHISCITHIILLSRLISLTDRLTLLCICYELPSHP